MSFFADHAPEEIEVSAPAGALGLVLAPCEWGAAAADGVDRRPGHVVVSVRDLSPLRDLVVPGDQIAAIDRDATRDLDHARVVALLEARRGRARSLRVLRDASALRDAVVPGALEGAQGVLEAVYAELVGGTAADAPLLPRKGLALIVPEMLRPTDERRRRGPGTRGCAQTVCWWAQVLLLTRHPRVRGPCPSWKEARARSARASRGRSAASG